MKTTTWTSSSSFHKVKPPFHHPLDIFGLFSFLGIKTKQRLTLKVAFVFILKSTKKKCRTVIIPIHFYTSGLKLSTLLLWRRQAHFLSAILKLTLVAPIDSPAWSFHYREIRWAVGGWVCCPHQERVIIISTWGSEKKQKKPRFCLSHSLWKLIWHLRDNLVCRVLHSCHLTPFGICSSMFYVVSLIFVCVTVPLVWKRRPPFLPAALPQPPPGAGLHECAPGCTSPER